MDEKPITRIDIEQNGDTLKVMSFIEGWEETWENPHLEKPDSTDFIQGKQIYDLFREYEQQGFVCEMPDGFHGRALRGKITRIDFIKQLNGWAIKKYCYGWTENTPPIEEKVVFDVDDAVNWCIANGWTVRKWPNGARAFRGQPKAVRSAKTITSMRKRLNLALANSNASEHDWKKSHFDLAFDY